MRILVTGSRGMLGHDLGIVAESAGHWVIGADRPEIDITSWESCLHGLEKTRPEVVVNCAAWTAVDDAETNEAAAFRVNAIGAYNLARAANLVGSRLVQISTDYVLRGDDPKPQSEDATVDPCGAYGRTKAAGEWAVRSHAPGSIVVRTAWLYGVTGQCFPKTVRDVVSSRGRMAVVDDQYGQPTWAKDVSSLIVRLIESRAPAGVYHGTSSGGTTWFGFAKEIAASAKLPITAIQPTSSSELAQQAPRPAFSALGHGALTRIGVEPVGEWRDRWLAASSEVLGSR